MGLFVVVPPLPVQGHVLKWPQVYQGQRHVMFTKQNFRGQPEIQCQEQLELAVVYPTGLNLFLNWA